MHILKTLLPAIALASIAAAGPTLACHEWVSTPGSVFEALEPLRDAAMSTANHPEQATAARMRITELRAQIRPGEPLTLLKAGYWIAILNALRITEDTDGPDLIRRAAEMRADDPEYQFFTALAYFDTNKQLYRKYWMRAQKLAKPGTAVSKNLAAFEPVLLTRR
ncbi:MAG: hypothetical protein JO307_23685 [Bryobacterales bacterium]|nr:hypothetical protein [Bryobacterales bacterium]MBV9398605.1 hypothetical protein [Bryobacterales bacterium]